MANFTLTAGADTVVGGAANDTVNGTAATLSIGDNLAAGAGTDTLALYGSGTFRIDQLAAFSGFESITLNNFTNGYANLYLGNQSIAVMGFGSGSEQLRLGSGAVTFHGGSGYNEIYSGNSALNWNAANVIDGASSLFLNVNGVANATYDLTANTLTNIGYLYGYQQNLTVKINSAAAVGVTNFFAQGTNDQLVTSDATLDLSHSKVAGFTVASTNATGTNFTVHDIGTAFQITGGSGSDTITAQGFSFSADQRNAVFSTASVEKIIDASGTYTAANVAPVVAHAIVDQSSAEDTAWNFTVPANTFSDIHGGVLTYTASLADGSTLPAWLSFNATTRSFTGIPPANFSGQVALKVTASDGSLSASDTFTLTIAPVNDPPMVTSNAGGDTATVTVAENATAVTTVTATDPDAGQTLSYSISGGADAGNFTIGSTTGALSFITAPNFELPTDAGGNNIYDVIVQVSDGAATDTQALAVTVTNANDAPTITSNGGGTTGTATVSENSTAVTTVTATDPDGTLTYSIVGGDDQAKFTINASTGVLSFVTAPDFELPTDAGANNVYEVTVRVSDGILSDAQTITVNVADVNDNAPVIVSGLVGGLGNDLIYGGPGNDVEVGNAGADVLVMGDGDDYAYGGTGNDYAYMGNGNDIAVGEAGVDVLLGEAGNDNLFGGDDQDYLFGGSGTNVMFGGAGIDVLNSEGINDVMYGGADGDYFYALGMGPATAFGEAGNDIYVGGIGTDTFSGGDGQDCFYGQDGNDVAYGGTGVDVLLGQGGNDFLFGGGGAADYLFGGAGADVFGVQDIAGANVIQDFNRAEGDLISIQGTTFHSFADVLANTTDYGSFSVITINPTENIWVIGQTSATFQVTDFAF